MKRLIVIMLASLMILSLSGCFNERTSEADTSKPSRMVTVEHTATYRIMYDRETRVMYAVAIESGTFTVLLDTNGKPLLYEEEQINE